MKNKKMKRDVSDLEVEQTLCSVGRLMTDYFLVQHGHKDFVLGTWDDRGNIFYEIIDDDDLFEACIQTLLGLGVPVFSSEDDALASRRNVLTLTRRE